MEVKLWKGTAEAVGKDNLKQFGVDFDQFRWEKSVNIDLAKFSTAKCLDLKNLIVEYAWKHKGAQTMVKDIEIWMQAAVGGVETRCSNTKIFHTLVIKWLAKSPRQHLYLKHAERDVWFAHYVYKVTFTPTKHHAWGTTPQHTTLYLAWREMGKVMTSTVTFYDGDVKGKTVAQAVKEHAQYLGETPELRADFEASMDRYVNWHDKLGMQFWATGEADDDLDGNGNENRNSWWKRTRNVRMDKDGEPGRILIDVFKEEDTEESESKWERERAGCARKRRSTRCGGSRSRRTRPTRTATSRLTTKCSRRPR